VLLAGIRPRREHAGKMPTFLWLHETEMCPSDPTKQKVSNEEKSCIKIAREGSTGGFAGCFFGGGFALLEFEDNLCTVALEEGRERLALL